MAEVTMRSNPVYKTINKPLTIMGIERTLFATALFTGAGFQVLFSSFLGAIVIFAILLYLARIATHRDPKMLVFIIQAKEHVVFEGTVLESVLVNRLNGDFAGPVLCQLTNDVYSHDHSQLLIPAGTRVLGETKKVSNIGQARLAVVFHRLIMPDGYAVDLDQAPGLNQIGETALKDKVNNHYFRIFGASIAVGAISGLATIGQNNSSVTGLPTSSVSGYEQGVAGSLSQSSLRILDKFLNIPPTITIREGHRVRIYLTQDLQVPAYAQHKMPSDL